MLIEIISNLFLGDPAKGELGFTALPGQESQFKESIVKTIEYAKALGAKK